MKSQAKRNITLSLPVEQIQKLKILAAQRDTSMSALVSKHLEQLDPAETERAAATAQMIKLMENAKSYGVVGEYKWNREDAYDHLEP